MVKMDEREGGSEGGRENGDETERERGEREEREREEKKPLINHKKAFLNCLSFFQDSGLCGYIIG